MKKIMTNSILCIILISTIIYSGCVINKTGGKIVTELTDIDKYKITNVSIRNGLSGELTTTDNRITIIRLINQLDRYPLEKMENQEPMGGYRYAIRFYDNSNEVSRIVIVDSSIMRVDEVYYEINDSTMDIVTIEELISSSQP